MLCGKKSMIEKIGAHRFEVGLDEKVALVGVPIARCSDCGNEEVTIPRMQQFFLVLAQAVAQKPERLTPKEIGFLRKHLELSNEDLAEVIGIHVENARKWQREKNTAGMTVPAERLLRALVLGHADAKELSATAIKKSKPFHSRFRSVKNHWKTETAKAI
jgi:putative zinc finger/helix-turn-helix YgiT family protein